MAVDARDLPSRRAALLWTAPNVLTLFRVALVPVLVYLLHDPGRLAGFVAALLFFLASLTDYFDGYLARKYGIVTTLGKFLDPLADKLIVTAVLIMLAAMPCVPGEPCVPRVPAWVVVVIVGRELAVTGLRAVAASVGVIVPASRLAKWKTVSQYVAITMLIVEKGFDPPGFHVAAATVLWVALGLTVGSAVDYFYRFFRKADYRAIVSGEERWS